MVRMCAVHRSGLELPGYLRVLDKAVHVLLATTHPEGCALPKLCPYTLCAPGGDSVIWGSRQCGTVYDVVEEWV